MTPTAAPPPAAAAPMLSERVTCSLGASARFGVPANIVLAIAEQESGRPGLWVRNRNGTYDLGTMQFNTAYVGTLAAYGITVGAVNAPGCYPYELAAWRLRAQLLTGSGDLWTRVADYNSKTPWINRRYRAQVMAKGAVWGQWLKSVWPAIAVAPPGPDYDPTAPMSQASGRARARLERVGSASGSTLQAAFTAPTAIAVVFRRKISPPRAGGAGD